MFNTMFFAAATKLKNDINMGWIIPIVIILVVAIVAIVVLVKYFNRKRDSKDVERQLKMIPLLIHLPPETDDIQANGRDERDINDEAISQATVMYSIIASTLKKKGMKSKLYGQRYFSFEILAKNGLIKYYAIVPAVLTETVKQAILTSYPTARLEETHAESIFNDQSDKTNTAAGEFMFKKPGYYPVATYTDMKWDAQTALLNAFSKCKKDEGLGLQIMFKPATDKWSKEAEQKISEIRDGKKGWNGSNLPMRVLNLFIDVIKAPFEVPDEHKYSEGENKPLSQTKQEEVAAIEEKTRYPGFEVGIRVVAAATSKPRAEALVGGIVAAFSQFDTQNYNGFKYNINKDTDKTVSNYIFRAFPNKSNIVLNSVELASMYHLPHRNSIPTSGVERQETKQVDGPAQLVTEGITLGVNEYRGEEKIIKLGEKDRRRHVYVIGATGMGKSVFLKNLAYQDMMDGRGFAFIDPHGDVAEEILSMVPPNRIDDVIYFDPGSMDNPIGMNMFEYQTEDQKDFIVQEGINMLYSLYDPGHTGIFGPRGEQMFRNAALLLMADPKGATFIDVPRCFIDPELVKEKLKYVTDKNVYDYWTKEFPASQKSNDAGEVVTWFASKWSPFISNTMLRNVLGQVKSGFNIRDVMDGKKILLVNLSKGKVGELNSKLLGMIFVMKFQAAAMSRVDTPEDMRNDFCLFVDEFQNFATDSFESILSEARKFRLNLIVANQFMTQLTDNIREGVLGNVGTVISGRVGVTDAELLEKVFTPTFSAQDLHNQANFHAIATVMMNNMPTAPFTMRLLPPMGEENRDVFESLKNYSATKYGRPRAEVDREINERLGVTPKPTATGDGNMDGGISSGETGGRPVTNGIPLGVKKVPADQAIPGNPPVAQEDDDDVVLLEPEPRVTVPKRANFLDKWRNPEKKPTEIEVAEEKNVEKATAEFENLVKKQKRDEETLKDGQMVKLH